MDDSAQFVPGARLPERVFGPGYGRFQFLEFDEFTRDRFWALLGRLGEASRDDRVTVGVLDPEESFLEIPLAGSASEYRECLDAADWAWVLVWFPPSLQWLVWAERETELMVIAFASAFPDVQFDTLTAEEALEMTSRAWRGRTARVRFAHRLMENYAPGRSWTDNAPGEAIAAAERLMTGQVGLIEASRSLTLFQSLFDDDAEHLFQPFAVIDRQTAALPIGPVRQEWESAALARKDIEIQRYEESQRAVAIQACGALISYLRRLSD